MRPLRTGCLALWCFGFSFSVVRAEDTLADLLFQGYQKITRGGSAASVFQQAIRLDETVPKHYALAKKGDPRFARICGEMGLAYQLEGKTAAAGELIGAAAAADPRNLTYRIQLGELNWQMRNFGLAVEAYEEALKLDGESAAAWNGKARCLQNMGEAKDAIRAYERAIELSPRDPKYVRDLARLLHHQGDFGRALKLFRRGAVLSPEDTSMHCDAGWILYRQGKSTEALTVFIKQTRKPDAHASCWFGLGTVLAKLGQFREAVHPLRRACKADPDAPGYWRDLGNVLYKLRKYEEAAATYRNALSLAIDHPIVWHHLGLCLEELGKLEEALAAYHTAASLDPMGDAWGDQMHMLNKLKRHGESITIAVKALERGTFDPKDNRRGLTNPRYVYRMLAEAYNGLRSYKEALRACDGAERASRETGSGVYHLCYIQKGDACAGLGKFEVARRHYKKALRGPAPEEAKERLESLEELVKAAGRTQ